MQDTFTVLDCRDVEHSIKIDNVKSFDSNKDKTITVVYLKELENNLWDIRTYESENSIRFRYSKLYDQLHKED